MVGQGGHTDDDGEECEEDDGVGPLMEEEHGEEDGEEGFHGLDGVSKGHGHEAEGEVGEAVGEDVDDGERRDGLDDVRADDDRAARGDEPGEAEDAADEELEGRGGEGLEPDLQELLVVDVEEDREGVPAGQGGCCGSAGEGCGAACGGWLGVRRGCEPRSAQRVLVGIAQGIAVP